MDDRWLAKHALPSGFRLDPLAVIRGLFLAPQLLPSIQYCSREGAEPRPCTLTRQLSKDDEAAKLLPAH